MYLIVFVAGLVLGALVVILHDDPSELSRIEADAAADLATATSAYNAEIARLKAQLSAGKAGKA